MRLLLLVAAALVADAAPSSSKGQLQHKRRTVSMWEGCDGQFDDTMVAKRPSKESIVGSGRSLRIVNGHYATDGQFPWQAYITMDSTWTCGGSLISDSFVLTAAQCASGYNQFKVVFGTIERYHVPSMVNYEYAYTYKSIVHEDYEEDCLKNDIGLLHLLFPIKENPWVRPVKLPSASTASDLFVGRKATISGWGDTGGGQEASSLKYVEQSIMDNKRCARFFGSFINDSVICGDGEGKVGTCGTDTGGPLVIHEVDSSGKETYTQIGISSFESDVGCDYGFPSAYTRVTSFLDWISANTGIKM